MRSLSAAVWVISIHLVSVVAATTSTCDMVTFNQSRSLTGAVQCATAPPPSQTIRLNTKMECSHGCAVRGATCEGGFNYKHEEALCEFFVSPPGTFQVQDGCEYYSVCTLLFTHRARQ